MTDFHFIRPEFLFALIPLLIFLALQIRQSRLSGKWSQVVAPQLREFVIKQNDSHARTSLTKGIFGLCVALIIAAAAGPTWEKQASQIYNSRSGIIVALDLSLSMTAQDVSPSRLQRAKYKITDILNKEKSRNIGLMAYASDTHTASPLTRDADTLKALLPALDPFIMPGTGGSNALRLAEEAANLFEQSKSDPKVLIMVTDGVEPKDIEPAAELLRRNKIQLSILAIGTEQGAPMLQPDGRFFKGADGQPIMPSLEWENLKAFASSANGKIQRFSNTDSDIDYLLSESNQNESFKEVSDLAVYDQWQDNGFWLMIPVLLLSLFAFRRGVVLMALLALFQPQEVWAMPDFLLNQDQKAHKQFDKNPEQAAKLFSNPEWKASSLYKAGKYEEALEIWQNQNDSKSWYNQGNAHAQLGQFDEAIYAYEQALANDENFADAQFNKELVEQLKQQQEQQNQDNQNQQDSSESQQGDNSQQQDQENQSNESQSNSEQSKSEPQDSTQQSEGDNSDNPMNELTDSDKSQQAQETEQNTQQSNSEEKAEENQQAQMTQTEGQQPKEMTEKDQAVMQMIQKIPDNPAGLLQRKFLHQYQQRNRNQQGGDRKSW